MNFKNVFWGILLIVVGSLFLIQEVTQIDFGPYFWPIIMITAGGLLLLKNTLSTNISNHTNS